MTFFALLFSSFNLIQIFDEREKKMVVNTTVRNKHGKSEFRNSFESETNACFDNDMKQSIEKGWMFVRVHWLVQLILNTRLNVYYELDLSDFWLRKILARCVINSVIWTNAWAQCVWVCVTFLNIHLLPPCTLADIEHCTILSNCNRMYFCFFVVKLHNTGQLQ